MASDSLPHDIQELMLAHVEGYEHLEVLLMLQATPGVAIGSDTVAGKLKISEELALAALEHLRDHGLLKMQAGATGPQFVYGPADQATADTVGRLAAAYRDRRLEVMKVMSENAIARLRTSAMRAFAEAFDLRKKDPDA